MQHQPTRSVASRTAFRWRSSRRDGYEPAATPVRNADPSPRGSGADSRELTTIDWARARSAGTMVPCVARFPGKLPTNAGPLIARSRGGLRTRGRRGVAMIGNGRPLPSRESTTRDFLDGLAVRGAFPLPGRSAASFRAADNEIRRSSRPATSSTFIPHERGIHHVRPDPHRLRRR